MDTKSLYYQSATELASALTNKQISSVELVESSIARIESLDNKINAVVVRDFDRARKAAIAANKDIARGKRLPLLGLPMTVKESFNVAGLPTSWGNPLFKNWQPDSSALIIERLQKAGAIIIGKTNVSFMLSDWQSYNEVYGTSNNPWNLKLTPGGSSGGSAAALAAGFVPLELGSDLAGSLRAPAHFCGVCSHKPSYDVVPMYGAGPPTVPPSPTRIDLVVSGPMARTSVDLDLALGVIAGTDAHWDGKGFKFAFPVARHTDLRNFRALMFNEHPLFPTATAIKESIVDFADRLSKCGVHVSWKSTRLPDLAETTRIYTELFGAFISAAMPLEAYQKTKEAAENLSADDSSLTALFLRGISYTHRDWVMAMQICGQLRRQWQNLFTEFDVVLCPAMPTLAFPHDHSDQSTRRLRVDDHMLPYNDQFIWASIATLLGLPATVIPIARSESGLPIGIQIIGDYLEDLTTLTFAQLIEQEFGGFSSPPPL